MKVGGSEAVIIKRFRTENKAGYRANSQRFQKPIADYPIPKMKVSVGNVMMKFCECMAKGLEGLFKIVK